jgi:hypothetical protein
MLMLRTRTRVLGAVLVASALAVGVGGAPAAWAVTATATGPALLRAIDVQDVGTFDRVTFSFRSEPGDPVPTIRRAEYVDRPILADASGMEVPVSGGAVLELVLELVLGGASAFDADADPPQPSYTGPTRIEANPPSVIEVVETGDFESALSFAIGVRDVIVDVPHVATPVVVARNFTG